MTPESDEVRLAKLETWRDSHEKGHENSHKDRLKAVENRQDKIGSRVDGLFVAVLMVIAGMAGTIITLVTQ